MQDLADHPFSPENIAYESGESDAGERAWLKWVARAKHLLDLKSLDGDQSEDGYSLDGAYEAFEAGHIPESYAADVTKRLRIRAQAADLKARFAKGEFGG